MRKSLFPQDVNIPKFLKNSPFASFEQIDLMKKWIIENPLDKSGNIKYDKLAHVHEMNILIDAPHLKITQEEINEMLLSLNMNDKSGEKVADLCGADQFQDWLNGNDVLAWKFRSILPYVPPRKDTFYPCTYYQKPPSSAAHMLRMPHTEVYNHSDVTAP